MRWICAVLTLLLFAGCASTRPADPLAGSRQVVVVTTESSGATRGAMMWYERDGDGTRWRQVAGPIRVVLGRNGLAVPGMKREGDGKSPAGIFTLTDAFGFDERTGITRLRYTPIVEDTECVDDSDSRFYNTVTDRHDVARVDWTSSEKMRSIGQYRWGIVVNHNVPATPSHGSCIFLHIWGGPASNTAGCTAMSQEDLEKLLRWLDPAAHPRLVQMTFDDYSLQRFLLP